jgi:hypothetical protein
MGLPFQMPMRLMVTRPRVPGLVGRQNLRPGTQRQREKEEYDMVSMAASLLLVMLLHEAIRAVKLRCQAGA